MRILHDSGLTRKSSTYDAEHAADAIRELEEQRHAGDIEQAAYIIKKRSLVRLYVKATTTPIRKSKQFEDE